MYCDIGVDMWFCLRTNTDNTFLGAATPIKSGMCTHARFPLKPGNFNCYFVTATQTTGSTGPTGCTVSTGPTGHISRAPMDFFGYLKLLNIEGLRDAQV